MRLHDGGSEGAPISRKQLSASSSGQSAIRGVKVGGVEAKCTRSSWPRRLAPSAPCGAACIEVAVEAAAHGCCVAQKGQLDRPLLMVVLRGAVIQNLGFWGVLRRRAGRGERRGGGAAAGWWCGGVRGPWRRCARPRAASTRRRGARRSFSLLLAVPSRSAIRQGYSWVGALGNAATCV